MFFIWKGVIYWTSNLSQFLFLVMKTTVCEKKTKNRCSEQMSHWKFCFTWFHSVCCHLCVCCHLGVYVRPSTIVASDVETRLMERLRWVGNKSAKSRLWICTVQSQRYNCSTSYFKTPCSFPRTCSNVMHSPVIEPWFLRHAFRFDRYVKEAERVRRKQQAEGVFWKNYDYWLKHQTGIVQTLKLVLLPRYLCFLLVLLIKLVLLPRYLWLTCLRKVWRRIKTEDQPHWSRKYSRFIHFVHSTF